ncbi:MAG: hypothetical protein ACP5IH_03615 [Desulfurella sp.]|uniref:Uncharacterized protein n=1 Tax=Desulfurella multipotens TaxID=79269 RepID=A0A1G6N9I8_9BACT|nr:MULTISPECIES: hypothetical protein [Desulfurella]PMP90103.1 MAG: hypothetical protein C0173_04835 [Desulfurella sp.]SDC64509.1 hypothetical protein SAMN05660835_01149 [Desulfurella multipotens]HEX13552.1 hypothetical protein [Desulfurella acetivorans]
MPRNVAYIVADDESEKLVQKATIDSFAKQNGFDDVEYFYESQKSYVSWKNRDLGKVLLPSLNEGDNFFVTDGAKLGNSTPETDVVLMYFADKQINVYFTKIRMKIL